MAGRKARKVGMTPSWCEAVKPEAGLVEWRDAGHPGLSFRVHESGKRFFWVRYTFAGRDRRYRLGPFPAVTLKAAREAARRTLGLAASGTDPQLERERLRVGQHVSAAVTTWLDDQKQGPCARWKGGLDGGTARGFMPHIRRFERTLGKKRLSELTPKDIEHFVSHGEAPATRNRALTALRLFFWWAGRKQLVGVDPSAGLGKEREVERSRTLTDDELRALVRGFDATRYGRAVRLLALSGLRRDEVLGAAWSWLDAEEGTLTIPADAEKTGRSRGEPRRVALSPQAVRLLADQRAVLFAEGLYRADGFVFATTTGERPHADCLKPILYGLRGRRSNGQAASTDLRAKARPAVLPDDCTIHDIRRTVGHAMIYRLGVAQWTVEHVVLGHVRPRLLRTYAPVLPLGEGRAALTRWADLLAGILGEAPVAVAGPR